jgi:hypothetical protein
MYNIICYVKSWYLKFWNIMNSIILLYVYGVYYILYHTIIYYMFIIYTYYIYFFKKKYILLYIIYILTILYIPLLFTLYYYIFWYTNLTTQHHLPIVRGSSVASSWNASISVRTPRNDAVTAWNDAFCGIHQLSNAGWVCYTFFS